MTYPEYNHNVEFKNSNIYVYFDHLGREITFKFSIWSGLEQVFINKNLVSKSRNWKAQNTHCFNFNNTRYKISIAVVGFKGFVLGRGEVILKANEQGIDQNIFCYTTQLINDIKKWFRTA